MKKAAIALAVAAVSAAGALNISAAASAKTIYEYDYSRAGYSYVSVDAADLLERMLGTAISASEREYLNTYSDFTLKYNDKVAGKNVQSEYRESSGALSVSTAPYSYTADKGGVVRWTASAVNGEALTSGTWNTTITDDYTEDFVTVSYSTSFAIAYSDINNFINRYYTDAKYASETLAKEEARYEREYAQYLADLEVYQQYLQDYAQYEKDLAAYNEYLGKLSEWSIRDRRYKNYLAECAEYEKELAAYEAYQKALDAYNEALPRYQQYLADKANYDKLYAEYLEKISDPRIKKELAHIEILDYIFTPVYINGDNARTLYSAVMGDSVTQVLSRLGEVNDSTLSWAHIIREPIDDAEKATKNLRDIFSKLNACKTDEDKYVLYIATYDSLKTNLNLLLQTLDYFFRNSFVRSQIQGYEGVNRDLQFKIMLAQLYTVCNALDNGQIPSYYQAYRLFEKRNEGLADQFFYFDGSYTIKDKDGKNGITPNALLKQYGGEPLTDTNDAQPNDVYVSIPEEPTEPEAVEKPEQPQRVQQPVAPEEVADPGEAPEEVKEPIEPDKVKNPVVPIKYQPTESELALAEAYNSGTLYYRNEIKEDYIYLAYCEVQHYFRNAELVTIAFYLSRDDDEPAWTAEDVQAGSSVEYEGEIPKTTPSRGHTSTFAGWEDDEGNIVDINEVPKSGGYLKLYPRFTETANMYAVIWIVAGKEYPAEAAYGTIPDYNDTYEGVPQKADDPDGRKYRFTGWDKEIAVMSDNTVYYRAEFDCTYFITFDVNSVLYVQSVWTGELPAYAGEEPQKPNTDTYYYVFSGWNNPIVQANRDVKYTAQFDRHFILDMGSRGAAVELQDGMYFADCSKATPNAALDLSVVAEWAANAGAGIILKMSSYTITFSADEAFTLYQSGAYTFTSSVVQINSTTHGYGTYRYTVELAGSDSSAYGGSFTMCARGTLDPSHSYLYRIDGDNAVETRYTYDSKSITFSMRAGVYEIYPKYEVKVFSSEDVEISVSADMAAEKEVVTLTVGEPAVGKFIDRIYVLDSEGNEIELGEDYTFLMPEGDVSVGVVCGFIEYTVVFKFEGVVVTRTYHYGDEVVPPQAFKAPDGEYSYTFVGWDKEVERVTGDAEYTAVFEAVPLPTPDAGPLSQKMQLLIWVANHLVLIIVVAAVVFALIVTAIVLIVRHRKKKKIDKKQS